MRPAVLQQRGYWSLQLHPIDAIESGDELRPRGAVLNQTAEGDGASRRSHFLPYHFRSPPCSRCDRRSRNAATSRSSFILQRLFGYQAPVIHCQRDGTRFYAESAPTTKVWVFSK